MILNVHDYCGFTISQVTYLEPGEESEIDVINSSPVKLRATAGPVLGPPWQRPENGYVLNVTECYAIEKP